MTGLNKVVLEEDSAHQIPRQYKREENSSFIIFVMCTIFIFYL